MCDVGTWKCRRSVQSGSFTLTDHRQEGVFENAHPYPSPSRIMSTTYSKDLDHVVDEPDHRDQPLTLFIELVQDDIEKCKDHSNSLRKAEVMRQRGGLSKVAGLNDSANEKVHALSEKVAPLGWRMVQATNPNGVWPANHHGVVVQR